MGVYVQYQAMPEASRLARRLRTERPLCVMYCHLIHLPAGPYDSTRLEPRELDDHLTWIAGNSVFESREEVDRVYGDLLAELARAADEHPGLPNRSAYFKLQDFDEQLERALTRAGQQGAARLAETLVLGAEPFAPDGFGGGDVELRFVQASLVEQAARLLRGLDDEELQGEPEWEEFRGVYLDAAVRGEAVVIA